MRRILETIAILAMFTGPLQARERSVESRVYVESSRDGVRAIDRAENLRPGDRVVTVLDWESSASGRTMTSAVPAHLSFLDASSESLEVSTDGGRSWQLLGDSTGGKITHLRWRPERGRGRLAYSAIVR